jgi:hypothetical protein
VEAIRDLDGIGEVFAGNVSDPGGPIAQDGPLLRSVHAAPSRLALDTLGERRTSGMIFVAVFPPTARVSDQRGLWPGSPGWA